jgi:hypothetical protein
VRKQRFVRAQAGKTTWIVANRFAHARSARFVLVGWALMLLAIPAPAATAAPAPCAKRVIADWLKDGRLDRQYRLHCYSAAIDSMPNDLRDYSDATDAILRSLASAVVAPRPPGGGGGDEPLPTAAPVIDTSGASASFPLPLLLVGGVSLASLGAGLVAHLARRAAQMPGWKERRG